MVYPQSGLIMSFFSAVRRPNPILPSRAPASSFITASMPANAPDQSRTNTVPRWHLLLMANFSPIQNCTIVVRHNDNNRRVTCARLPRFCWPLPCQWLCRLLIPNSPMVVLLSSTLCTASIQMVLLPMPAHLKLDVIFMSRLLSPLLAIVQAVLISLPVLPVLTLKP